jgi:hypothetical protein
VEVVEFVYTGNKKHIVKKVVVEVHIVFIIKLNIDVKNAEVVHFVFIILEEVFVKKVVEELLIVNIIK